MKFVYFRAISEQSQTIHEFPQTDRATAIFVKQTEESLSKKGLEIKGNLAYYYYYLLMV